METLIAIVALVAVFILASREIERQLYWRRKAAWKKKGGKEGLPANVSLVWGKAPDQYDQLRAVDGGIFSSKPIMNKFEYRCFAEIEKFVLTKTRRYRVLPQISLGAILSATSEEAGRAIGCKRADIVIVSPTGYPVLAIECQGGGHYQNSAAARDAMKKEALRKAQVPFIELFPEDDGVEIQRKVERATNWEHE